MTCCFAAIQYAPNHWDWPTESEGEEDEEEADGRAAAHGAPAGSAGADGATAAADGHDERVPDEDEPAGCVGLTTSAADGMAGRVF